METVNIGEFNLKSGTVRISDPCYEKDTWCAGTVDSVKTGKWLSSIVKYDDSETDWGDRVGELHAYHESKETKEEPEWEELGIDVGVDSGQAGIFDEDFYGTDLEEPVEMRGNLEYNLNGIIYREQSKVDYLQNLREKSIELEFRDKLKIPSSLDTEFLLIELKAKKHIEDLRKQMKLEPVESKTDFYEVCCDKTLGSAMAGAMPYGVVSRSGFGDGSYAAYACRNKENKIIGLKIVFISEEEIEEEVA